MARHPAWPRLVLSAGLSLAVFACADGGTAPEDRPCQASAATTVEGPVGSVQVLTGVASGCLRAGVAGRFAIVTQLSSGTAPVGRFAMQVGPPTGPTAAPPGTLLASVASAPMSAVERLHAMARAVERRPVETRPMVAAIRRELPVEGSTAPFSVLRTLTVPESFATVTAQARYVGQHIVVYVDTAAPAVFGDADWRAMGRLFDTQLYPMDTSAFGSPSDLDGNGRVIVLFTPVVNALVTELQCAREGFVNGFFYGHDLQSTAATSNQGEVFYAYVPDPTARFSCPHTADEVRRTLPATFAHELQHMISYQAHVLSRRGPVEATWLNEGLSHIAEVLGGRLFETRYPAPSGRAQPGRLLPDSAVPFTLPNIQYAYDWLVFPTGNSVTLLDADSPGSLTERGAALLFLRWLETQRGPEVFRALVQTDRIGWANVEAAGGRPFAAQFADFGTALVLDSLPGLARPSTSRWRVAERALRREFLELNQLNPARAPQPYPLAPLTVSSTARRVLGLPSGGMGFFQWTADAGALLRVARTDDQPFGSALGAQVIVVRLP